MQRGTTLISIKNLSIGYFNKIVLENLSIDIDKNDVVAILGLNGTGKSTLLRTISGLQPSIKGEIYINGKNVNEYASSELATIVGIVLPGRGEVMQALTVYEILSIARSPYTGFMHTLNEEDTTLIRDTIQKLNVEHLIHRKIYQLSDGEAQKVFMAKVLVQHTPVLFLDEPTSHLDIHNKIEIFSLIKKLGNQNKTIVFASHELDLAIHVANKCLLIDKSGNVVFGKTSELIKNDQFPLFFNDEHFIFNKLSGRFEIEFN